MGYSFGMLFKNHSHYKTLRSLLRLKLNLPTLFPTRCVLLFVVTSRRRWPFQPMLLVDEPALRGPLIISNHVPWYQTIQILQLWTNLTNNKSDTHDISEMRERTHLRAVECEFASQPEYKLGFMPCRQVVALQNRSSLGWTLKLAVSLLRAFVGWY